VEKDCQWFLESRVCGWTKIARRCSAAPVYEQRPGRNAAYTPCQHEESAGNLEPTRRFAQEEDSESRCPTGSPRIAIATRVAGRSPATS